MQIAISKLQQKIDNTDIKLIHRHCKDILGTHIFQTWLIRVDTREEVLKVLQSVYCHSLLYFEQ